MFPTPLIAGVGIKQNELRLVFQIEFLDPLRSLSCRDNRAGITVLQRVHQGFIAKLDVERHSDHARANNSERSGDPFRTVFREEGHGIAAFEILFDKSIRERPRTTCEFFK